MDRQEKIQTLAQRKALLLREKCKRDPVFWLENYVKTFDEHDKENPIKDFPRKEYVREIVKEVDKN